MGVGGGGGDCTGVPCVGCVGVAGGGRDCTGVASVDCVGGPTADCVDVPRWDRKGVPVDRRAVCTPEEHERVATLACCKLTALGHGARYVTGH